MENTSTTIIHYLQVYSETKAIQEVQIKYEKTRQKLLHAEKVFSILQSERDLLQVYL